MPLLRKDDRVALRWIAAFALIRAFASFCFGLGYDETHYVLYARFLDWSYFDHPPLVGWAQWPLLKILGPTDFGARLPSILLFSATSFACFRFLMMAFGEVKIALRGLWALNFSVLLNVLGIMLLPDCFLLLFVYWIIFLLVRIGKDPRPWRAWAELGVVLGLCGLAKYTAALFLLPILVYLWLKKLISPTVLIRLAMAGLIGLVLVSPVFIWNARHDWMSFRYQTDHVVGAPVWSLKSLLISWGRQVLAYGPLLFLASYWGLWKAFKSKSEALKLAAGFGAVVVLFFAYSSLSKLALPHWTSVFYCLFIPIGVAFLSRRLARVTLGVSGAVLGIAYFLVLFQPVSFPELKSPFRDVGRYGEMMQEVNREFFKNPKPLKVIGVTNWSIADRVYLYNLGQGSEVQLFDDRMDQFDLWNPKTYSGADVLFLVNYFMPRDIKSTYPCERVEAVRSVDLKLRGNAVDRFALVWCRNYRFSSQ